MFAFTHPAFGLGDPAKTGLMTSFGLGARPTAIVETVADRPLSADFVSLIIDLRMKQYYKESLVELGNRQGAAVGLLDTVDSNLTRADVQIRQAEHALRHVLLQRRLQS